MLWVIDIYPAEGQPDLLGRAVLAAAADFGLADGVSIRAARGYLVQGELNREQIARLASELLADSEIGRAHV